MSTIDHVGLATTDFARSLAFYTATLGTLGIKPLSQFSEGGHDHAGFGREGPDFWIGGTDGAIGRAHVAFAAKDRPAVDAFYQAAIAAGARDNGPPGLRPHYHPNYYGAFVLDPDGHNIEAVCHAPA